MKNLTDKNSLALRWTGPLILTFLLFSGTCGLIYEILWMKMLTLVIGNTVFSITTVLTSFMGESYRQIQKLRPDFALTNYNLGVAYFKQNQWAKAEKEWMRALELKPDFSEARNKLNDVREKIK